MDSGNGEPNNTEQQAISLGSINDPDTDGGTVNGVMFGGADVDWFKYHGTDTAFGFAEPTASLSPNGQVRLCEYAMCDNGQSTVVTCQGTSTSSVSPSGLAGCCDTTGFAMGIACGSTFSAPENATIFIRLDNPQSTPCVQYTLSYHY